MVHLILSSTKGNQGLRYFPYTGYLGLTPVRVEGVVRTKLDSDHRNLHAKRLTVSVRCYESRVGRVSTLHSNVLVDYTQELWAKPATADYEPIGNLEYPFRITIPAKVAGFSTTVFVEYRCMWRVEAVLSHVPINGVGARQVRHFELPLIRYDLPPCSPRSRVPRGPVLSQETSKPRAPRIRYSVTSPTDPIGPLDLVPILIHLLPLDHGVSIRSASVIVERRIQLHDPLQSPSTPAQPTSYSPSSQSRSSNSSRSSLLSYSPTPTPIEPSSVLADAVASSSSLSSSNPTITPGTMFPSTTSISESTALLLPPPASSSNSPSPNPMSASKSITHPVAGAESSGHFSLDSKGIWSKTLTLQWPAAKSHSRWAIGESIESELVSVKYFVKVKIIVSSPSGTESLDLSEKELLIVSTNDAERQLAISKYNEAAELAHSDASSRSKSKSPRRSRVALDADIPPSPAPSSFKPKHTPRRPHTSAGPRDKPLSFGSPGYSHNCSSRDLDAERDVGTSSLGARDPYHKRNKREDGTSSSSSTRKRPDTAQSEVKLASSVSLSSTSLSPRIRSAPSASSTNTTASSSSVSSSSQEGDLESDHMREWEEELARIELRSRRSSDLLGFSGKRKRSTGAPRVVIPGENV